MTSDICGIDFKRRPGRGADGALSRGTTSDGSRGFQPTESRVRLVSRRGATGEWGAWVTVGFKRRDATRYVWRTANRGLKPTATIMGSLRDREAAALAKKIQKNFEGLGV